MSAAAMTPPEPETYRFQDDGTIPNSRLPALLYRRALDPRQRDLAGVFERLFDGHGWRGAWRNGIYPFHHFHSTTHEVLGCARGRARVRLGGENGATVTIAAGDVVVIPAGVGHKHEASTPDFQVVGAYPDGRDWDVCRGEPGKRDRVRANLACVPMPATDPVHGHGGPLLAKWG
jgi:uncharacterized protein YjlB